MKTGEERGGEVNLNELVGMSRRMNKVETSSSAPLAPLLFVSAPSLCRTKRRKMKKRKKKRRMWWKIDLKRQDS